MGPEPHGQGDMDIPQPAKEALDNKTKGAPRPFGQGGSKSAEQRRRRLNQRLTAEQWHSASGGGQDGPEGKGAKGSKGSMPHPPKYGQYFVTGTEGTQICYAFAKGQPGAVQNHAPINVFAVARCAWDNIPAHNVQRVERAAVERVVVFANDVWIKAWKNAVFMYRMRMRAMHSRALISVCKARIRTM